HRPRPGDHVSDRQTSDHEISRRRAHATKREIQSPCLPRFPLEEWQRPDCVARMGISRTDEDWRVIKRLRPPQRIISTAEMKRRIKRIAPLHAGKMLGALYARMGLICLPCSPWPRWPERLLHRPNN